jgi:hydrogenase nickel incorporation protein HypA/HybF
MHESNFTQQIVRSIISELNKYPDYKPKRVKVKVGEMLHPDDEDVRMHYDLLTQGTKLEGVDLDLEETKTIVSCKNCHHTGIVVNHHLLLCPSCASTNVKMISGDEIAVESIDLEN